MNNRIKEVREYFKLSQGAFGQRIGLAKSGISRIENGRNGTTDQTIKSICREFGVSEEWLRTGEGSMLDDSAPSLLYKDQNCSEHYITQTSKRLLALRKHLNLTQKEFGAKLGVSRDVIASLESGRVLPKDAFIKLICTTYQISEEWLRTGEGSMLDDTNPSLLTRLCEEKHLTPREQALVSAFFNLSPQDRAAVMRYVDGIADELRNLEPKPQEPLKKPRFRIYLKRI